ncbi:MAG: ribosomal RNA large subunit methyltransferase I [Pirellulaceae bacterium]|nr:MAG: ribosomal RNA large subunit methyltransferase I [Pirellulaceae bacterium]
MDAREQNRKAVFADQVVPMPTVRLKKQLTRLIKQGHAWIFSDAIENRGDLPPGVPVRVLTPRGDRPIASGLYDPEHPIRVRVCRTEPPWELDHRWLASRLHLASTLRRGLTRTEKTTGYRLVNGEGDRLPGLIVDIYGDTAVVKLDGGAPEAFYDCSWLGDWLVTQVGVRRVVRRYRQRGRAGEVLCGMPWTAPVEFLENGMRLTADCLQGQKTGFFLDQRDNRQAIAWVSSGRSVLNLFSYTGGFSVAAGMGGAKSVTSVDSASRAIADAQRHWELNQLPSTNHEAIVADCFEFLEKAASRGRTWDLVVSDPPSFAPNQRSRSAALAAYAKLAQLALQVTAPQGLLAVASCSSHIGAAEFYQLHLDVLAKARRPATLLLQRDLPCDHPTPLAMPEMRYLKFLLFHLAS